MTPDNIRDYLHATPFVPIVLHMGNGRSVEVRHPEMALVGDEAMAVSDGGAIRLLAIININEIETAASSDA